MDDTGTTQIGKYVFNHPFLLPGAINITIAVALGFVFGSFILSRRAFAVTACGHGHHHAAHVAEATERQLPR